jgi:putative exosortase-associated protein (TIGR04073 family)
VAAPAAPVKADAVADDDSAPNPAFCFGRGLSNLALCWLEIPRCVVYDNAEIPFFGILVGIPEGALLTVARVGSGVFDILSLGFSGDALHGKRFPDFIWESKWMPKEKEK